ncbi:unnamed protein product [Brassicogethes aeneus]|uniref:Uncharacterized protein n=1 Tax=Brassicogethes aeneus TaxID=1431903 RepID=A0A9P0AUV0_BRAAE|nr:unnamed protein product [Brassicogethes aeneus]
MEEQAGILMMLLISTLSVFRIKFDHVLNFTVQSSSLLQTGVFNRKKRVRRATVTGRNNEINLLAATAANPHASRRELSRNKTKCELINAFNSKATIFSTYFN